MKPSLKNKFKYWFDNWISKGSKGLLRLFLVVTAATIIVLSIINIIIVKRFEVESVWDIIYHLINGWFPETPTTDYFSQPEPIGLQTLLLALAGIIGILLTSVFIGIITSAIEERITNLKKGDSIVLEEGHTVILGFYPGEYELLNQLILASSNHGNCIVIASDMEKDEVENAIRDNLDVPNNIRIVCRTLDICDPVALEKCSLPSAKVIIISPTDDMRTTKILLAVSKIINNADNDKVRVGAIMSNDNYRFPPTIAEKHNVTTIQTNNTIAKMIAHSCTQPGISEVFKEIFNFEGNEFYNLAIDGLVGMTFQEVMANLANAIPVGIGRNGLIITNPTGNTIMNEGDTLLVFSENKDSYVLEKNNKVEKSSVSIGKNVVAQNHEQLLLFGSNETLPILLKELPEDIDEVMIADDALTDIKLQRIKSKLPHLKIDHIPYAVDTEEEMLELVREFKHIVVLSDHKTNSEENDLQNMMLLLRLRDLRRRYNLEYNITVELQSEANQRLVSVDDQTTDFVVATSMASLFLAQLAESPELYSVFTELLSNAGNEVYLKKASYLGCSGSKEIAEIRQICLANHYIFLGYKKRGNTKIVFNPPLHEVIELTNIDDIIVIGEH